MEIQTTAPLRLLGNPAQGLFGATLGFFVGFAAVSLFGPTVVYLERVAGLTPALAGLLVSVRSLSGSLPRVPFSAMVDATGGRRPFLILLGLSVVGLAGVYGLLSLDGARLARLFPLLLGFGVLGGCGIATFSVGISQTSYWFPKRRQGVALGSYAGIGNLAPGVFALLLSLVAIPALGLAGSYLAWLAFLVVGLGAYALLGRNSWYFQLMSQGLAPEQARERAQALGQELFPKGTVAQSLKLSASVWQTWALVGVYFTTFGGFIALTAWLPKYWSAFHGLSLPAAGLLTAGYSILASLMRVAGGRLSDRIGGIRAAACALLLALIGALGMSTAFGLPLAVAAVLVMAVGMGVGNAAVFKLVPEAVPEAVGGAAGWIGGLGAFGGFVIPNLLAAFVRSGVPADPGYARGFAVFVILNVLALGILWVLGHGGGKGSEQRGRPPEEGET